MSDPENKTDLAAKPPAKPKKRRKPAKKALDVVRLQALAEEINATVGSTYENLLHRLETEEGLKLKKSDKDGGLYSVDMAGVKATGNSGPLNALNNWGNAARRAILKAA